MEVPQTFVDFTPWNSIRFSVKISDKITSYFGKEKRKRNYFEIYHSLNSVLLKEIYTQEKLFN
jgi:hypothetical protein